MQKLRKSYSESFKKMVIEEHLQTGCTKASLLEKYEIPSTSALQTWMRKLGYWNEEDGYGKGSFGKIFQEALPKDNKKSQEHLQKRIRELEQQLEDEKLRSEAYARIIDKAEKELKIPIRKKPNTR